MSKKSDSAILDKTAILKDILNTVFEVVVVYACEMLKAQQKYPEAIRWFDRRKPIVENEVRNFVEDLFSKNNFELSESRPKKYDQEEAVFLLMHLYWDAYQYEIQDYDESFLEKFNIDKQSLTNFFSSITRKFRPILGFDFDEPTPFIEEYVFSALLSKERLLQSVFKYFKMYYMIENKENILKNESLPLLFLELFKDIPYYSIISKSSVYKVTSNATEMGNREYAHLLMPIEAKPGAVIDNMIHFMFKYLVKQFHFYFTKGDKENFDIWCFHKAARDAWIEPDVVLDAGAVQIDEFAWNDFEHYERLIECISTIQSLKNTLPKIINSNPSTRIDNSDLLLSILYANFIVNYDFEHPIKTDVENCYDRYRIHLNENAKKTKAFLRYLEKGFTKIGFEVIPFHSGSAETSYIWLKSDENNLLQVFGRKVQDNFGNHKIHFKYQ